MSENVHAGHRERLKNTILSAAPGDNVPEEKILEMLLFYGIPQKDTLPIAKELLERFGSISGVVDADPAELVKVKGMTRNAASLIKFIPRFSRSYVLSRTGDAIVLKTFDDIGRFVYLKYFGVEDERFSLLCINRVGKVLSFETVVEGNVDMVGVSVRRVVELVIKSGATAAVIAHNHPGGIALPSQADVSLTKQIAKALSGISVNLVDHLIVVDDDYVSMAQTAEYSSIFEIK